MKVVQVPFCFYPDSVGGTEVYVQSLARSLHATHGLEVTVVAPGVETKTYEHAGLRVRRFAVASTVADVSELYGEGDESAAREFDKVLEEEQPDIVHLHAFTRGVSLRIVWAAKARKIPVVFTYHTPTVTCTRGTMMRWGRIPCDGEMLGHRCTACTLQGHGLHRLVASAVASTPRIVRHSLRDADRQGGPWTALRMRDLVELRHNSTRALLAEVDHVVAVCDWVRDVLLHNNVPPEKITMSRQGINQESEVKSQIEESPWRKSGIPMRFTAERPLRLVYFGRLDPTKGVHVVIEALKSNKSLPLKLDIYGSGQGDGGTRYEDRLRELAKGDPRIEFQAFVPSGKVIEIMRTYDAAVVPSQWMETGPLVVLEAFAAGIPVIGSNLGGIAELVENGVNGLLVLPVTVNWRDALRQVVANPEMLIRYADDIKPVRNMRQVADETTQLYRRLMQHKPLSSMS